MTELDECWNNAVIYGVDVERFGDGDGMGNFAGLIRASGSGPGRILPGPKWAR